MKRIPLTFTVALLFSSAFTSIVGQQTAPPAPVAPTVPSPHTARAERRIVIGNGNRFDDGQERGLGSVPSGAWWRNPETIKSLNLTPDQQKKLEDIFRQNRIQLIHLKASLEEEQINLEPLVNANPVDSAKAMAEITRIADLRADLEKANAKMLLGLRGALTAEQWTRLQSEQRHVIRLGPMQNLLDFDRFHSEFGKAFGPIKLQSFNMPPIHLPAQHFSPRNFPGGSVPEINIQAIDIPSIEIPEIAPLDLDQPDEE